MSLDRTKGAPILLQSGVVWGLLACLPAAGSAVAETVRMRATSDVWLSGFQGEEAFTAGQYSQFKLKSIQEMALVRFDPSPAAGREVRSARLYLHRAGKDLLRYVRVSTVSSDWVEGSNAKRLSAGDGASYNYADNAAKRPWSWEGSQLCDVIMGSGHSRTSWAERQDLGGGWISVELTPELVYAMVAGDTDGLAVMDGGALALTNNFIHSIQSDHPPYIEVELATQMRGTPTKPQVRGRPCGECCDINNGAIELTIAPDPHAFCWRMNLNGRTVPRWRIPCPASESPTTFCLDELPVDKEITLEIIAVSASGITSPTTTLALRSSGRLPSPPKLGAFEPPGQGQPPPEIPGTLRVWACPPLVKVSPMNGKVMYDDAGGPSEPSHANAVWDGQQVRLCGARGQFVSYQIIVSKLVKGSVADVVIRPSALTSVHGASIGLGYIDLYRNWYARNASEQWQPAYCVPHKPETPLAIPDPQRKLPDQISQGMYVDLFIPKDATAGTYTGRVDVGGGGKTISLPVELKVLNFTLPDELAFWPQLNTYQAPPGVHDFYRLAHDHRCVLYYRYWKPETTGAGKDLRLVWDEYDRNVGPLLTGEAFRGTRRGPVPVEAVALPFFESWPTPLSKEVYNYQGYWPGKGDSSEHIVAHYMKAPYIAEAFSQDYIDAWMAAERQFIEHFRQKGWDDTEMQAVFVSKNTHRINHGVNMWWTTDEPYHWDDWLALRYFCQLWTQGRQSRDADQWVCRADISRPQWQGRVLDGLVDTVYFGGVFGQPAMTRRCRTLTRRAPLEMRVYGSANRDNTSNLGSAVWILHAYLNGATAALPWQTLGNEKALDINDRAVGGNALLVPGGRFGTTVVADMRLKAFRDAEQICESLRLLAQRRGLDRRQLRAMVAKAMKLQAGTKEGAAADNADAMLFGQLRAWQLDQLRRRLGELIEGAE